MRQPIALRMCKRMQNQFMKTIFQLLSLVGYKWDFTTNIVFVSRLNKNAEISPTDNIHGGIHLGLDQDL